MATKKTGLFVAFCTILVAGLIPTPITFAVEGQIVDEGFVPSGTFGVLGRQGVKLMERPDYIETASVLRGHPNSNSGGWKSCSSLSDSNCTSAQRISFGSILQPCATATSLDCIVAFGVIGADGTRINATVERKFPAEAANKYPADVSTGLPEGGPGALWTMPTSAGLPVSLHYLRASVIGSVENKKATFSGFAASLTPVSLTSMKCDQGVTFLRVGKNECTSMDAQTDRDEPGYSGFIEGSGWGEGLDCEMSGNANYTAQTAECALRKPASLDTKYFLDVRLSQSPQGWLHGRLASADVTIKPVADAANAVTLSIIGASVRVPVVYKEVPFGTLPASLQEKYKASGSWPGGMGSASNWGMMDTDASSPSGRNRLSIPPAYGASGIEELEAWMDFLKDTSTADRVTWSLRTLRSWERSSANSCIADSSRVTGLVLTNATQYMAGAPVYNEATKSLDYKVGAPHYMSNGAEFKGSYEMIVRADVAKCIYGFTTSAVKAEVAVVESESGQTTNVVTAVSLSDGWFRLSAKGYTHSAPTIRTVFTQETAASVEQPAVTIEKSVASVKAKKSLSSAKLVKVAGLKTVKSSKVVLKVAKSSSKVCQVQSGVLRGLKKGSCRVTVTVTTGKKKSNQTILVSVT